MTLLRLITQRRRWRNTFLASTYYMLTQVPSIMRSNYTMRFKIGNLLLLGARIFEYFLCLLSPAIFGIWFMNGAGLVGGLVGPTSKFIAEGVQGLIFATLYAAFVYVHLKRSNGDCVLQPKLVNLVFIYTTIMSFISFGAMLHGLTSGQLANDTFTFSLIPIGMPFVNALISGSYEGFVIMIQSWLIYFLTAPFAGFCGAYNLARLADISWGNRPAASAAAEEHKNKSIGLQNEADMQQQWLERQMSKGALLNLTLVFSNIAVMVLAKVFLPRALSRWNLTSSKTYTEHDVLPYLFIFFSSGSILQLLLGFVFHANRRVLGNGARPTVKPYAAVAQQMSPMDP